MSLSAQDLTPPPISPANQILASLPPDEFARLSVHLYSLPLTLGDVLVESGEIAQQVYFVEEGMLSCVLPSQTGPSVEAGVIGREGVGGVGAALVPLPTPIQIMVQATGSAQVMETSVFRTHMQLDSVLYQGVMRHQHHMLLQAAQGCVCNRQHTQEERLSRWLLMVQDRVQKDELELKSSFLSMMLGIRESGVKITAGILKKPD